MKKIISWVWSLFGRRFCLEIKVGPDIQGALKKRNRKIVRDFKRGYSILSLAEIYNVTENRLFQILTDSGAREPKWTKMSRQKRQAVFQMQKKGLSKAKIGRKIGVSRERVRQILKQE